MRGRAKPGLGWRAVIAKKRPVPLGNLDPESRKHEAEPRTCLAAGIEQSRQWNPRTFFLHHASMLKQKCLLLGGSGGFVSRSMGITKVMK